MAENSTGWKLQRDRFLDFIQINKNKKVVVLELGIGSRNRLIKAPTMNMVIDYENWKYITLNMPQEISMPSQLQHKSIALEGDISMTLRDEDDAD